MYSTTGCQGMARRGRRGRDQDRELQSATLGDGRGHVDRHGRSDPRGLLPRGAARRTCEASGPTPSASRRPHRAKPAAPARRASSAAPASARTERAPASAFLRVSPSEGSQLGDGLLQRERRCRLQRRHLRARHRSLGSPRTSVVGACISGTRVARRRALGQRGDAGNAAQIKGGSAAAAEREPGGASAAVVGGNDAVACGGTARAESVETRKARLALARVGARSARWRRTGARR